MIHILLFILKIIGIIILSIFLFLAMVILVVLFVPIKYRIQAEYGENTEAFVNVSWLFHILTGKLSYTDESNVIIKLLGISIYNANKHKKKAHTEKKKKERVHRKKSRIKADIITQTSSEKEIVNKENKENISSTNKQTEKGPDEKKSEKEYIEKESDKYFNFKTKIKLYFKKIKKLFHKMRNACKNIKYTLKRIYDNIKVACNHVNYYYELLHSSEAKKAYIVCRKQIKYVWKNIKPRKYKVYLRVGNEDPAITGQIMALYGILYPIYTNHVIVVPEFEQNILEGNLLVNGKIKIFGLLCVLWIVYFDKNLRLFLLMLKKEE